MSYLVMECHPGYAVVLDSRGRFIKVANKQYKVGQRVDRVFEMETEKPASQKLNIKKWIYSAAAMAACLVLLVTGILRVDQSAYASVYLTINPQVRIDVNRKDMVVDVEGVNEDGKDLTRDYSHKNKSLDKVMDELVDRAIEMDYLHEGGKVAISLDSKNEEWVVSHKDKLTSHLNEHLNEKITVTVEVKKEKPTQDKVTIPVLPQEEYKDSDYGQTDAQTTTAPQKPITPQKPAENDYDEASDYSDSDYGETESESAVTTAVPAESPYDEASDYDDSDYNETETTAATPQRPADTDYNNSDYGSTDYKSETTAPSEASASDYDDIEHGISQYHNDDDDEEEEEEEENDFSDYDE